MIKRFLSYIVMAGLFFFLLPVASAHTAEPVQVIVQASSLNVRLGPGTEYWSQGKIISGTSVSVLAADSGWLLVRLPDGSSGWISGNYTSNPHAAPLLSIKKNATARTTIPNINIRTGPGTHYTSFDQLPAGTEVQVLTEENGWFLVRLSFDSTGWVSKNYVLDGNTATTGITESGTGLKGRIIALDPGHGGWNTGATGVTGLKEKVVNFQAAEKLAYYLRQQGASVIMTRTGDYEVSLADRVNICHNKGAHIFISIHNNAHTNRIYSGTETYYYNKGANAASSRRLATLVQQELVRTSGLRSIGVHHGTFYVIRTPRIPSILVEIAFLSNYHDESLLRQDSFLDGQARAMSKAIVSYFQ